MTLKKRIGLILSGLSCVLLVACGSSEDNKILTLTTPSDNITGETAKTTIQPETTAPSKGTPTSKAATSTTRANRPAEKVAIGFSAPDFTLKTLQGESVQLSQLQGRAVLINFWATWCGPCKEELPLLVRTYEANKDQLEILGVDVAEEPIVVRLKVKEVAISYTTLLDSSHKVSDTYRVNALPTSFFVDKDGVIQVIKPGAFTQESLRPQLDKILK